LVARLTAKNPKITKTSQPRQANLPSIQLQLSPTMLPLSAWTTIFYTTLSIEMPSIPTLAKLRNTPNCPSAVKAPFGNSLVIRRLAQGFGPDHPTVVGTNTMFFKCYSNIPKDHRKDITYVCVESAFRPEKANP
jgi:hypothetical protein